VNIVKAAFEVQFGTSANTILRSADVRKIYDSEKFAFANHKKLGSLKTDNSWIDKHIGSILKLKAINRRAIKRAKLKVVVDAVNGAGSIALPQLLESLDVEVIRLNCDNDGNFVVVWDISSYDLESRW